jgi:hypothetical protein
MRSSSPITRAVLAGTAALLVAGCGSNSPPTPGIPHSQSPVQSAFAFTRCMRSHGVEVPDPQVSTSGAGTSIRQVMPASAAAAPAFKAAQKACAHFQPGPRNSRGDQNAPNKLALVAFARCLRADGVSGFPDPTAAGQITSEMLSAAGINFHGPAFFRAAKRCVGVTHGQITMAEITAAANAH